MSDGKVECLDGRGPEDFLEAYKRAVFERHKGVCGNCGSADRVRVRLVVPQNVGGQAVATNAVLLCRTCEMVRASAALNGSETRPINLWVSRAFHENLKNMLEGGNGFRSMSSLVRWLIDEFVVDDALFDDLGQFQDEGTDVKINVWVNRFSYETFKARLSQRGMTVTDGIKGLVCMYNQQAMPRIKGGE